MYLDVALLPFYVSEAFSYLAIGGVGYLSWRLVRAYERRGIELERLDDLTRRLERVEIAVDQAVEAQHFATALLASRPAAGGDVAAGNAHAKTRMSVSNGGASANGATVR